MPKDWSEMSPRSPWLTTEEFIRIHFGRHRHLLKKVGLNPSVLPQWIGECIVDYRVIKANDTEAAEIDDEKLSWLTAVNLSGFIAKKIDARRQREARYERRHVAFDGIAHSAESPNHAFDEVECYDVLLEFLKVLGGEERAIVLFASAILVWRGKTPTDVDAAAALDMRPRTYQYRLERIRRRFEEFTSQRNEES